MSDELVGEYVDRGAFKSDTQFIKAELEPIIAVFNQLKEVKINIQTGGSLKDITTFAKQGEAAIDTLNTSIAGLSKTLQQNNKQEQENLKTKKAVIQVENEVIKQIQLEDKAEQDNIKTKIQLQKYQDQLLKSKQQLDAQAAKAEANALKEANAYEQLKLKYNEAANESKRLGAEMLLQGANLEKLSPMYIQATKSAQGYYNQLFTLEQKVGQSQRQVGNYRNAQFALNQVLREAPSFVYSLQTGFLAISNNLPILVDEINKLKKANVDLVAAGEKPVSVMKTFAGALFSFNTIVLLAVTALTFFGGAIADWIGDMFSASQAAEKAAEGADKLVKSQLELIRTQEQLNILNADPINQGDRYSRDLTYISALNKSKKDQLELERKINYENALRANQQFFATGGFNTLAKLKKELNSASYDYSELVRKQGLGEDVSDKEIERAKNRLELFKEQTTRQQKIVFDNFDTNTRLQETMRKQEAYVAEQSRKITLESTRIKEGAIVESNERILANDKSTLDERIKALQASGAAQKRIARAVAADTLADPSNRNADGTLTAEGLIAIKERNALLLKISTETSLAIAKQREDFRIRDLNAATAANKVYLEEHQRFLAALYDNEALAEEQRLEALQRSQAARRQLLDEDFTKSLSTAGISDENIKRIQEEGYFEIANKKITNQELFTLIVSFNQKVVDLDRDVANKKLVISKDYYLKDQKLRDEQLKKIQKDFNLQFEDRTDTYNNQIVGLNNFYTRGKISLLNYNKERLKIEGDYAVAALGMEIEKQRKLIALLQTEKAIKVRIQQEIKAEQDKLAGAQTDKDKEASAARLKILKAELEAITATIDKETELFKALSAFIKQLSDQLKENADDTKDGIIKDFEELRTRLGKVFSLIDGVLNAIKVRRLNDLAAQKDAVDEQTKKETEAVNASVGTAQDKAAKIIIINQLAANKKAEIARREREAEISQMRFDKFKALFEIAINTAIAVTKALTPIGKALAIAYGAAQAAIVLATPIPRYKGGKGQGDNYEGLAIVNDGGVNEPILRADGTIELNRGKPKDTLTWLGSDDVVYSSLEQMLRHLTQPNINFKLPAQNNTVEVLAGEMAKQTGVLNRIANKKELSLNATDAGIVAIHKFAARRVKYFEENTNWG